MTRIYVPRDSSALSLGAEKVAKAIAEHAARQNLAVEIIRNGSRGMFWLEPLVEVETPAGRIAYGPVDVADVPSLFAADFVNGGAHALKLGVTDELPWLKQQERLTFARVGITDPVSLTDYLAHDGYRGLQNALALQPAEIVQQVTDSGLRGRGGAAFPTGIKWKTVHDCKADQKYIVCNADEGDSGTFADRMIMEGDPFVLIEGMAIAGLATGATKGFVYTRSEYPHAIAAMTEAVEIARKAGVLGPSVMGSGKAFDIEVRMGAGAYVCGEETALLNSLEGKRGIVRAKPPLPAHKGLFASPTVINNVISLASVPVILDKGAAFYRDFGMGRSRGTIPLQIAGNVKHGGLYETAFGLSLGDIVDRIGGGTATGRPVKAVQVGGPLGAYFPRALFDTPFGPMALVMVGAIIVGGIETVWNGRLTPPHRRNVAPTYYEPMQPLVLQRGAELGRFHMGSTVIVLAPAGALSWKHELTPAREVRLGEALATMAGPTPTKLQA